MCSGTTSLYLDGFLRCRDSTISPAGDSESEVRLPRSEHLTELQETIVLDYYYRIERMRPDKGTATSVSLRFAQNFVSPFHFGRK